ncbi:MAG: hypothetical protein ACXV6K_05785 [Halobacteriota archaeon]
MESYGKNDGGPVIVCGTVILDAGDIIAGAVNSIDVHCAIGGSLFLLLVFVVALIDYRGITASHQRAA